MFGGDLLQFMIDPNSKCNTKLDWFNTDEGTLIKTTKRAILGGDLAEFMINTHSKFSWGVQH